MKRGHILMLRRALAGALVGLAAFLCWGLGIVSTIEGYIWFDPYIDTWYAPGYRPELESRIKVGMTCEEVEVLIGVPLLVTSPNRYQPGLFGAVYTNDGGHDRRLGIDHSDPRHKCFLYHKDFAWHYFNVMYDSTDVVRKVYSGWAYD
jgi:hypothetical protein